MSCGQCEGGGREALRNEESVDAALVFSTGCIMREGIIYRLENKMNRDSSENSSQ